MSAEARAVDKTIEKAYALKDEIDRAVRSGGRGEPNGATGGIGSAGNRYSTIGVDNLSQRRMRN